MDISVKARNYCAEVTVKGDNCSLTMEATCIKERVDWSYQLINAAYDVISRMDVTTEDETIESVHDKLSSCLDELYQIKETIKKK
jgi:hypothetical protein